jgi:hypothetical protein
MLSIELCRYRGDGRYVGVAPEEEGISEATAARTGGRSLGNNRRRGDAAPADQCVNLPHASKGLNRYRDSAHFEVGSQLIGQP